jgi:hypothetical protein
VTSTSKSYLTDLKTASHYPVNDDSDNESDDGDIDPRRSNFDDADLPDNYDDEGNSTVESWFANIKRDPVKRARGLIRLLRSSDERRQVFRKFILDGNKSGLFAIKEKDGKRVEVDVPDLELLRDVKTRWDSVYMMLERLRLLRPVRSSRRMDNEYQLTFYIKIQALDAVFNTKFSELSAFKLSESDWDILEGLEGVLAVSWSLAC